jgi:hypothetical protein
MHNIKQQAYEIVLQQMQQKIAALEQSLLDIKESISNETKSTAGDKYETARAMLHIEQENLMKQLAYALNQKNEITTVDINLVSSVIENGSLITTNFGMFFIVAAMGKIEVAGNVIITLSKNSPLGILFMGKQPEAIFDFGQRQYVIKKVE